MITSTICRILLGKCGRDSIYVLAHSEIRHVRRQNYRCYKQKRRRVRKLKLNWQSITEQYLRLGHRQYLLHHSRWIRSLSVQAWSRLSRGLRRWSGIKTFTNPAVLSGFRTEIEYTTHARCLKTSRWPPRCWLGRNWLILPLVIMRVTSLIGYCYPIIWGIS